MDSVVAAKAASMKMSLSVVEKEKLEQYEKQDKLNAKEKKMKDDFLAMDADGDGTVSIDEMGKILRAMKMKIRMSESDIRRTLREFDMDGNGEIEVSEFLYMMSNSKKREMIHRAIVQHSAIKSEFQQYDKDGSGYITEDEFKLVYQARVGLLPTKEQFKNMLKNCDKDNDGKISYDEFLHLLLNTPYKPVV